MHPVYIKNYGIHQEYACDSDKLKYLLFSESKINLDSVDYYESLHPALKDKSLVQREDRSVLNSMSKLVLNALSDLSCKVDLTCLSEAKLYTAADSEEHSFVNIHDVCKRYPGSESLFLRIKEYKNTSNPLDMLRLLPTNVLYHTSKVLLDHEEGTPLRTASLSGLTALKLACSDIEFERDVALVVSAANMKSFESLAVFKKFNEIRERNDSVSGIIPSWGAAVLLLDSDPEDAIGQILSVTVKYRPKMKFDILDWEQLFNREREAHGEPDIIVSYANGIKEQNLAETDAINKVFPNTKVINYKLITGYTGKLNNVLDILCCLNDPTIPKNTTVMLNGAGINYGYGCIWLIKH
ncbi:hypothetical protein [Vibrio spartinae]|uniref:Uncharacterized protein n=1 Tax=Vibrio spartinae TaxID=1918945 RepID=A0A1N6M5Q6_9VIBR|nr:hypothetical protein [Vibrio spartinae]SIO94754.1 hypothetical protein VSP9026_02484 [Vibrio spartinae]